MNNKHIILLITVVIIAVVVYIYNKREDFIGTFGNFGNQLTYRGQGVWKDAKVVRIINDQTGMCLTYQPVGMVRLAKSDINNRYQYWIYSRDGYILQPGTDTCLSYHSVVDDSVNDGLYHNPILNICTQSAGQRFYYDKKSKKLINMIGWPYSAIRNIKRLEKMKMRCLTHYPIAGGPRNLGFAKVVIAPCKKGDKAQEWTIQEMTVGQARAAQEAVYSGYTYITASNDLRNLYPLGGKITGYNLEPCNYKGKGPRPAGRPEV